MDSLSQILTMSNIQYNSKVLLVESCQGLVAGAILNRLGGEALSYNIHVFVICGVVLAIHFATSTIWPLVVVSMTNLPILCKSYFQWPEALGHLVLLAHTI